MQGQTAYLNIIFTLILGPQEVDKFLIKKLIFLIVPLSIKVQITPTFINKHTKDLQLLYSIKGIHACKKLNSHT